MNKTILTMALAALSCASTIGMMPLRATAAPAGSVTLIRTPNGGIQPQALVDNTGTLHLIYFTGDPGSGDVYYVHKKLGPGIPFSKPIRVNSLPGSAMAIGTIRGAQMALGRGNRVLVAWNGTAKATQGPGGTPMLFARLNDSGTAFEPQRNLITKYGGLDGGGSVAADANGHVYVTWHAITPGHSETIGNIYMASSFDNGKTFAPEKRINPNATGACGCCSMRAYVDKGGSVYVLYRSASDGGANRDTILLVSNNAGRTFQSSPVHRWPVNACPMTSFSFAEGDGEIVGAWETSEQVYFGKISPGATHFNSVTASPGQGIRKYPVALPNSKGQMLFAWAEGCGWAHGGAVAWQVYNKEGRPTKVKGRANGVPTWSLISAFARPDGSFAVVY